MPNLVVSILLKLIDRAKRPLRNTKEGLDDVAKAGKRASKSFDLAANLQHAAAGIERLGEQARRAITQPVLDFTEYEKSIAEVSTLVDSTILGNEKLIEITEQAALAFGGKAKSQAEALYQTISAGASDAAKATAVLNAANRLAIGGVTDVETAVDGLTTVLNAYSMDMVKDAVPASDSFFVAVRAGKTTVGELSKAIGKVAPLAAAMGLSLDETNAAIATLTTQGIDTRFAVSGLKAAFSNILKPTKEAQDAAEALGIDFSIAALKAKGFKQFLADVTQTTGLTSAELAKLQKQSGGNAEVFQQLIEASGGNITAMSTMFGSIEGINAILALSANEGAKFTEILAQMENKTGATEAAFAKMEDTQAHAFGIMKAQFDKSTRALGQGFMPAVNDALKSVIGITNALTKFAEAHPELVKQVGGLLIKLVALSAVMRTGMLVAGLFSSIKGIGGLVIGMRNLSKASYEVIDGMGDVNGIMKVTAKRFVGSAGLIALAGGAGYAFGRWADDALGLSDALAGVNREIDKFKRGAPAFLTQMTPQQARERSQAQKELTEAQERYEQATSGITGGVQALLPWGPAAQAEEDIKRLKRQIDEIDKVAKAAGEIEVFGPEMPERVAKAEELRLQQAAPQETKVKGEININTKVEDDRVVQTVRTSGDLGETRSVDTGIAGVGT
jgi:TP901 family phage tail tape measure protein